jgi:hypothetical protein
MWVWKRGCIKMTIEWLAGNRLRGTTAEKPTFGLPSGSVGGWVELGRTTLGSTNVNIDVTSLADKRYLMFLVNTTGASAITSDGIMRVGNSSIDTGSNYAHRSSFDGGSDSTGTSATGISLSRNDTNPEWTVGYFANLSTKEKLSLAWKVEQGTAGAANAPKHRIESAGKWTNTSNVIDQYRWNTGGSETWSAGSEVVVLGWDPTDTHTTNFWEELASVELGSANANITSGTITAKKYLWVQAYFNLADSGTTSDARLTFNSDTGSNYATRNAQNGGAEQTLTSQANTRINYSSLTTPAFLNLFIVNNSANEKLMIGHLTSAGTAGAGGAPDRRIEYTGKWTNTSSQITNINFNDGGLTDYPAGTILKVWGSN